MKLNNNYFDELRKGTEHLFKNDEVMSGVIQSVGVCKLRPRKKYFETLVDSIISQQLSLKSAESISKRFRLLYNNKFPDAKSVLQTPSKDLRKCGLSNSKIVYIKDLSEKVDCGNIKPYTLYKIADTEIINQLIQVKGIGIWTSHMFLIFSLGRLNVLPHGDLGFRKAIFRNYRLRKFPTEDKVTAISKKFNWNPYNTIAAWYHWQSLNLNNKILI